MTRNIQQLPNNTSTAQTSEVYTATGFNAGDAVYYQNGDYLSPAVTPSAFANPTGSLAFIPSATAPITTTGGIDTNIGGVSPVLSGQNASGYGFLGGSRSLSTALLSNGNIVNVWVQNSRMTTTGSRPYFQVTTAAGVQVVAPTAVSTVYTCTTQYNITVAALTGGGFIVAWINPTGGTVNRPCYAIYTNAGAVTLAATNDTTWGAAPTTTAPISATAMPNGGVVLTWKSTAVGLWFKILTATGTVTAAWTNCLSALASSVTPSAVAVRSDNSIFFMDWDSSTTYQYALYNSTGTSIIAATTATSTTIGAINNGYSTATCLTDGTTIYIGTTGNGISGVAGVMYFSFGASNVFSAETIIPLANLNYQQSNSSLSQYNQIFALSSGGFVFAFCDAANHIRYVFCNSSGTVISGTNANGALPLDIPNSFLPYFNRLAIIETTGFVNFYWSPSFSYTTNCANIFTAKISTSTYALTYGSTATITLPSITTSAASQLNLASSTLTGAKYNLVSNLTSTSTTSLTTAVPTPTTIASFACNAVYSATLPNGTIVVAYVRTSNYALAVNVYSASGVLQQTIAVATISTGLQANVRIAALSSGKFVVTYPSSTVNVTAVVYSTSFIVVYTSVIGTTNGSWGQNTNYDVAALTNDQYVLVIGAGSAGSCTSQIYSGTSSTQVAGYTLTTGAAQGQFTSNATYVAVRGNNYGGFMVFGRTGSASTELAMTYLQTSATSWTYASYYNLPGATGSFYSVQAIAYNGAGMYQVLSSASASNTTYVTTSFTDGYTTSNGALLAITAQSGGAGSYETAIGINAYGEFVQVGQGSQNILYGMPGCGTLKAGSVDTGGSGSFIYNPAVGYSTLSGMGATTSSSFPTIAPVAGPYAYLVYLQVTTSYPVFTFITTYPVSVTTTVSNSQVSSNSAVPITPTTTSSSTTIPNTILAGVAATTASAGSTGQLINNGLAQLNSSYPASANQSFDYTGQAVSGVKGIIKNRVLNLQGNS